MHDVDDSRVRPGIPLVTIHLAAVCAAVALGLPLAYWALNLASLAGDFHLLIWWPVYLGAVMALLAVAGGLTGGASRLSGSPGRQLSWVLLVTAGGGLLLGFCLMVLQAAQWVIGLNPLVLILFGLVFSLVAATVVRTTPVAWTARVTAVVVLLAGLTVIWATGPSDAQARVNSARTERQLLFTATIPGYRPAGFTQWEQTGSGAGQRITVEGMVLEDEYRCPSGRMCDREPQELIYWYHNASHGYVQRRATVGVSVHGSLEVDRALLRETVLSARPMSDDEIRQSLPPAPREGGLTGWIRSLLPSPRG